MLYSTLALASGVGLLNKFRREIFVPNEIGTFSTYSTQLYNPES